AFPQSPRPCRDRHRATRELQFVAFRVEAVPSADRSELVRPRLTSHLRLTNPPHKSIPAGWILPILRKSIGPRVDPNLRAQPIEREDRNWGATFNWRGPEPCLSASARLHPSCRPFPGTKNGLVEKATKTLSISSNCLGVVLRSSLEVNVDLSGKRTGRAVSVVMVALIISVLGHAQQIPRTNPNDLVRRAAANEIKANDSHVYFMFKDRTEEKGHSVTKEVIQTPQGGLTRTIAINDKPPTAEQRAKDDQKLQKF